MSQLHLDRDKLDRSIGRLEQEGQRFDKAQSDFALGAQAATGALSPNPAPGGGRDGCGIGEFDQFHTPLHTTLFASESELTTVSRGQRHFISQLRQAVSSLEGVNEDERAKYLERLAAVDGKFTYRRPEEMKEYVQAYARARNLLDRHTKHILQASDRLKQIVKASTEALTAGIDAKNESIEIQAKLKRVNNSFANMGYSGQASGGSSAPGVPGIGVSAAEIEVQRQAAHAKIDALAKKALSNLDGRIRGAIGILPPDGQAAAHAFADGGDRPSDSGKAGNEPAAPAAGPARSAAAWGVTVDTSLDAPGSYADDGDRQLSTGHGPAGSSNPADGHETPANGSSHAGGVSLQGTHYAPPSQPTAPRPSAGFPAGPASPAVFNPLASAAALGGGAAVAGYRAYQAARTARPVQTPVSRPSVFRAAGAARTPTTTSARSSGILKGVTTAARTQTTTSGSTAAGRSPGSVREGATGTARPVPKQPSGRSSGVLKGTTTAARTPTTSSTASGRSSGILKGGTTTVARKPATPEASAGQPGGRPAQSAKAQILTGRTPTATGTSQNTGASRGASSSSREGAAARSGSTSKALHSLTGRPDKDKKARRRNGEPTDSVTPYEDDKTITFLPAGHSEENTNNNTENR